jgi:hypothetical protein
MKIETIKEQLAEMSDEELLERFDLYTDLESIDSKTNVIIELMAQELDTRKI